MTIGEAPSLSPKGNMVAFMRRANRSTQLWIRNLEKDTEQKIAEFSIKGQESFIAYGYNASLVPPSWSKDGLLLAVCLDGYHYNDKYARVVVLKASGGVVKEFAARAWKIRNVGFSSDKKNIAFITQEHSEKKADETLDKQVHIATIDGEKKETFKNCEGFSWSPNGRYVAFVEENDTMGFIRKVWIFDTEDGNLSNCLHLRNSLKRLCG